MKIGKNHSPSVGGMIWGTLIQTQLGIIMDPLRSTFQNSRNDLLIFRWPRKFGGHLVLLLYEILPRSNPYFAL